MPARRVMHTLISPTHLSALTFQLTIHVVFMAYRCVYVVEVIARCKQRGAVIVFTPGAAEARAPAVWTAEWEKRDNIRYDFKRGIPS